MSILDVETDSDLIATGGIVFGVLHKLMILWAVFPNPFLRGEGGTVSWIAIVIEDVFGVNIHVRL